MLHWCSATSQLKFNQLPSQFYPPNTFLPLPSAMHTTWSSSTAAASNKKLVDKVSQKKLSSDESNPTDHGIGTNGKKYVNKALDEI